MLKDTDFDGNQDSPQQIESRQSIPNWQDQPVSAETSYSQASTVGLGQGGAPGAAKKEPSRARCGHAHSPQELSAPPSGHVRHGSDPLITAALGGGYLYWDYASHFESTDDAFIACARSPSPIKRGVMKCI